MADTHRAEPVFALLQLASPNRPGIVAEATRFVAKHQANIVTQHGVRFGRQMFASTMLVSAAPEALAKLEADLGAIKDLHPQLLRTRALTAEDAEGALLYEATLYAFDKEGLVAEAAELVSAEHLDIVQLSCVSYPAPFDGQQLFMIEMVLEAPNHVAAKKAHAALEGLAPVRGWDVYWKPILRTAARMNPVGVFPPSRMTTGPDAR